MTQEGGHGFFMQPKHLKYTFERIGCMLYGDAYESRIGSCEAPHASAAAAGF